MIKICSLFISGDVMTASAYTSSCSLAAWLPTFRAGKAIFSPVSRQYLIHRRIARFKPFYGGGEISGSLRSLRMVNLQPQADRPGQAEQHAAKK